LGRKLYYSIGEVSELTQLQPYTLRAWEKEFSCLRPRRVRGKNRAYRERDIGVILLIRRLLYEERYSTRGVRQKLKRDPELVQSAVEAAAKLITGPQDPQAAAEKAIIEAIVHSTDVAGATPESALSAQSEDGEEEEEIGPTSPTSPAAVGQDLSSHSSPQLSDLIEELKRDLHAAIRLLS
jgi:DNA-binding transcriptional MerR regulator